MMTSHLSRTFYRIGESSRGPEFHAKLLELVTRKIDRDDVDARRAAMREMLAHVGVLTVDDAWSIGHVLGFYRGGEGSMAKDDLLAIGRRHKGFWRYLSDDQRRDKAKRWGDYWTPKDAVKR